MEGRLSFLKEIFDEKRAILMIKEDGRARQLDSSKGVASVEDKLAMQYWERNYVYRERPSMEQAAVLQQEGQGKRLPFIEEGRLRAPNRSQEPLRW